MKNTPYTVLMSVYIKEKAEYLKLSIQSMLDQTVPPDEFILVKDGPLTTELDAVVDYYNQKYPGLFTIISNETNIFCLKELCYRKIALTPTQCYT